MLKVNEKRKFLYDEKRRKEDLGYQNKRKQIAKDHERDMTIQRENEKIANLADASSYHPEALKGILVKQGIKWDDRAKKWTSAIGKPRLTTPGPTTTTTANPLSNDNLSEIREQIQKRNEEIAHGEYSKEKGRHFEHIFVIQVHSRHDFLDYLLKTIEQIEKVKNGNFLLVLSHDIWNEKMNDLTDKVSFMPTVNIYFPKSTLFYKDEFPATDINDCPVKVGREGAIEMNCRNSLWSDTFGNYRSEKTYFNKIKKGVIIF